MKRRDFIRLTALGTAGAAAGTGLLSWSTRAFAQTVSVSLNAVHGTVTMVDGTTPFVLSYSTGAAPTLPGPMIVCQDTDTVQVSINNTLSTPVNFTVGRTSVNVSIAAGASKTFSFAAPPAGSYLYYDAQNNGVNRIMGLHGSLIVMPSGIKNQSFVGGPTFVRQYKWVFSNVDPNWGSLVQANGDAYVATINPTSFMPHYFLINGSSFNQSEEPNTELAGLVGDTCLVRILNAGGMVHAPHFHGNHVQILSVNGTNNTGALLWKDVVAMYPLDVKDVIYPFNAPGDAYPPASGSQMYPMHCHSEMSQTAGGGLYPHGLHTAINIGQAPTTESDLTQAVAAL